MEDPHPITQKKKKIEIPPENSFMKKMAAKILMILTVSKQFTFDYPRVIVSCEKLTLFSDLTG